jgi:hypothetical protein
MFNLNDIMGSITEYFSGGAQESEIVQQITENIPGIDQTAEPLSGITESLPEIPGLDKLKPGQ